jgi:hypothetical protein
MLTGLRRWHRPTRRSRQQSQHFSTAIFVSSARHIHLIDGIEDHKTWHLILIGGSTVRRLALLTSFYLSLFALSNSVVRSRSRFTVRPCGNALTGRKRRLPAGHGPGTG